MKSIHIAALAAFGASAACAAHAGNLVVNGGFEETTLSRAVSTQIGGAGGFGQFVDGWTEFGPSVSRPATNIPYAIWFPSAAAANTENARGQYAGSGREKLDPVRSAVPASPGGGAFVGLDGALPNPENEQSGSEAGIRQTVGGLVAGRSYVLSFDWAAGQLQSRSGDTETYVHVGFGDDAQNTPAKKNPSGSFTGWFNETIQFTATGASEVLSFLSVGTVGNLPPMALLDDVSLTPAPEPMSLAILGAGLTAIGVLRRRRA